MECSAFAELRGKNMLPVHNLLVALCWQIGVWPLSSQEVVHFVMHFPILHKQKILENNYLVQCIFFLQKQASTLYIAFEIPKMFCLSPQPPSMPLSPPAHGSHGPAPGSPCESFEAVDKQTEGPNSEQTLHKYEHGDRVFASQSPAYVLLSPVRSCVWLSSVGFSACHPDGGSFLWE